MKKIVFLTGTRADYGKLKSLMNIVENSNSHELHVFVTGMHLNPTYGSTVDEVVKAGFTNIYKYVNDDTAGFMDRVLAKTIQGFSQFIYQIKPDLIIVHGDRVEALAGSIVGSLNNILVGHIEGGEISGTIDELIRHAVSKLSHVHLVANNEAKNRLIQLGEFKESIFVIGSPDLDLMAKDSLPQLTLVKNYYEIEYDEFAIAMFHPVTTELKHNKNHIRNYVDALIETNDNYIVIYPNNDLGSDEILNEYERLNTLKNFKVFPSLRFEYFLRLLESSSYIIGNSSAGIREAPYYNIPAIDIGTRQNNRTTNNFIFNCNYTKVEIIKTIKKVKEYNNKSNNDYGQNHHFGKGESDKLFLRLLNDDTIWGINCQKQFQDYKAYM